MHRRSAVNVAATLIILVGAALRIGALARDVRFHNDEALYATYARRMSGFESTPDLLLAGVPLDKPPLGLSITAAAFVVWGPTEFAARLPTVLISVLSLAAIFALARHLYGPGVALVALTLIALSRFDLAFAATAFHDPPLTLFLLLMCLAASRERWFNAGVWAACALATKQSAVQFLPVFMLISLVSRVSLPAPVRQPHGPHIGRFTGFVQRLVRFAAPVIIGIGLLAVWSAARAAPVDFWTLGVINPGALRFIRSDEVAPRLARWLAYLATGMVFPPLLGFGVLPVARTLFAGRFAVAESTDTATPAPIDAAIAIGVIATLLLYWLLAYNTYDRYLHPILPLVALLVARGLWGVVSMRHVRVAKVVIMLVALGFGALVTSPLAPLPHVGGDDGSNDGIIALATAINALPPGSTVHEHWLGWALGYYLGPAPKVNIVWQPSPESLARAVCDSHAPDNPAYVALPAVRAGRWLATLRSAGAEVFMVAEGQLGLWAVACGN